MSSEKLDLLRKAQAFNRENSDKIRFDPNIPVTVILPADWTKTFKQESRKSRDGDESYVVSIFMVTNPNSVDPTLPRRLEASEKLYSEISTVIESSIDQGWDGQIIMKITKKVTGGNTYGQWSVQGQRFEQKEAESK